MSPTRATLASILLAFILLACAAATAAGQPRQSPAPAAARVAVYADSGAWADGIAAFERFLDWKGVAHERIARGDVNAGTLAARFTAIYFPGGYSGDYSSAITAAGARGIRELVSGGGAYVGICAGAYYAAKHIDWEGRSYAGELDLFQGTASGSITAIAPWPGYAMTGVTLNTAHPAARFQQRRMTMLYFGGPAFHPDAGVAVDTVATWDQAGNAPAIIAFAYGSGRVLLSGPHPEIEENGMRDSSAFGMELSDPESEWGLLWSSVDWVLGRTATDTLSTSVAAPPGALQDASPYLPQNYPNPFGASTTIRICGSADGSPLASTAASGPSVSLRVCDLLGRVVLDLGDLLRPDGTVRVHRRQLPGPGAYILRLQSPAGLATRMMIATD